MRKRRYEMLLPLKFNDGRSVPDDHFYQTRVELIAHFGTLTLEPTYVRGTWTHEGVQFDDELMRLFIDVEDTPENESFFRSFKNVLLERFEQIDIYLASYPVEIL